MFICGKSYLSSYLYAFKSSLYNKIIWKMLDQFMFEFMIEATLRIVKEKNRPFLTNHRTYNWKIINMFDFDLIDVNTKCGHST